MLFEEGPRPEILNGFTSPARRFPTPWSVRELSEAFCVCDADGFTLMYCLFDPEERGTNSNRMTRDEARRMANGIIRLPELIGALGDDLIKP